MSVISVADLKAHLNITGDADDALLAGKIAAAEAYVAGFTGTFPDPVPAPLLEAIRQLAGHLYENREATLVGESVQAAPFGFFDLINPYRVWAF